ncbi:hypothetical protein BD414DRAFT_471772 [Trametes punicea]|nr:hypothetical protein BD414DRAFT_471772 [Trametes punicea]
MPVPTLDDDVLQRILSYLHGRDALHVALCSKHLCDLALPRVPANATVKGPEDLRRTCAYMLSGTPPRAQDLEDLTIDFRTFDYAERAQVDISDYWDFSQALLVAELLLRARRLRRLVLERLHPCLEADPRIGEALASMDRLRSATFTTVADGTFALMPPLSESLRSLCLVYFWNEDDPIESGTKTFPALLDALAPVHHLRALHLQHFQPTDGLLGSHRPTFPSIRSLELRLASSSALELVGLCPNLKSLTFSLDSQQPADRLADGPRWPHLRVLELGGYREVNCLVNRVGTVDKLCVTRALIVGSEEEAVDVRDLLEILARTSPVCLRLPVTSGSAPMTFWNRISAAATQLRGLELVISLAALSVEHKNWLDIVPDALRPLRLEYLSVKVLGTETVRRPPRRTEEALQSAEQARQHDADAKEVEEHRTRSIAGLPERLAEAVSSLRLLSVAAAPANEDHLAGRRQDDDPIRAALRWSTAPWTDKMTVRHWRVLTAQSGGRTLQELTIDEADRVRALVESVRYDELSRMIDAWERVL